MIAAELDTLASGFEMCTIEKPEWTHQVHIQVGAWHVHHFGVEESIRRLRSGIRRLNDHHGTPNSETRGYHETITVAYVRLIASYLSARPQNLALDVAVREMLQSRMARKDFLLNFYSRDILMSSQARREWVEPDVAPLAVYSP